MRHTLHVPARAALYLLSLCLFAGDLGAFSAQSNHLAGSLALFFFVLSTVHPTPVRKTLTSQKVFGGIFTLGTFAIVVLGRTPPVWISGAGLLALSLYVWIDSELSQWTTLGLTAALFLVVRTFLVSLAPFWLLNVNASLFATDKVAGLLGQPLQIGPSVSGWWVCTLFLCHFIACSIVEKRALRVAQGLVVFVVSGAVFNLLNLTYPLVRYHSHTALNIINSQIVCFGIAAALLFVFLRAGLSERMPVGKPRLSLCVLAQALLLTSVAAHHTRAACGANLERGGRVVIFGTAPGASYDSPSFDRLGVGNAGMYGLLPQYIGSFGYRVRVIDSVDRLSQSLGEADILMAICPTTVFPPTLHNAVWRFVEEGGSLLVMGDHTDIFGSMSALNSLLEPVNIRFNFDTVYSGRRHWRYCYERWPHPVTRSLDEVNAVLQYGSGASLSISSPAYPVITGKQAFGDKGDYLNGGRGAYLGDQVYSRNEQLGDLILAAGAPFGRGKVLAFGDTSSFQNIAAPWSHEFLFDVLAWLSVKKRIDEPTLARVACVCAGLAFLVLIAGGQARVAPAMTMTMAALTTALFFSSQYGFRAVSQSRVPDKSLHIAYVDASHIGAFKYQHWEDESIDGLLVNLSRNGYLPFVVREFSADWLSASALYVSVSPLRPYPPYEQVAIEEFVKGGGKVLFAVGYEEGRASQDLLAGFGFRIDSVPLGAAPITDFVTDAEEYQRIQQEPHFAEAWPVATIDDLPTRVLYSYEGFPIAVHKQVGEGRVVVIGDGRFLLDKTLENEDGAWPGNIFLLRRMLEL